MEVPVSDELRGEPTHNCSEVSVMIEDHFWSPVGPKYTRIVIRRTCDEVVEVITYPVKCDGGSHSCRTLGASSLRSAHVIIYKGQPGDRCVSQCWFDDGLVKSSLGKAGSSLLR